MQNRDAFTKICFFVKLSFYCDFTCSGINNANNGTCIFNLLGGS